MDKILTKRKQTGSLTEEEKKIIKALLDCGWLNQDIQALVNIERPTSINSVHITEIKGDKEQKAASKDEASFFVIKKKSFDPKTGLNFFDDERLIRSREAIILAVQIFNSSALNFKTEVFAVLANIAWTYLLHEFYERKGIAVIQEDGKSLLLSQMIKRQDCPLSTGIRNNLQAIKIIRDEVEHKILGKGDTKFQGLFQACCLNFDKTLCTLFGDKLSLAHNLAFALQFAKMDFEQLTMLNQYEIPSHIETIDAQLDALAGKDGMTDLEYQFRVVYTLDAATKNKSHYEFIHQDSTEGKEIKNVLTKYKTADHLYPHKPKRVCGLVSKKTKKKFSLHNHTQAWKLFDARPKNNVKQPENTNSDYCIYHPSHNDYTYSTKWVELLIENVNDDDKFSKIKAIKI